MVSGCWCNVNNVKAGCWEIVGKTALSDWKCKLSSAETLLQEGFLCSHSLRSHHTNTALKLCLPTQEKSISNLTHKQEAISITNSSSKQVLNDIKNNKMSKSSWAFVSRQGCKRCPWEHQVHKSGFCRSVHFILIVLSRWKIIGMSISTKHAFH